MGNNKSRTQQAVAPEVPFLSKAEFLQRGRDLVKSEVVFCETLGCNVRIAQLNARRAGIYTSLVSSLDSEGKVKMDMSNHQSKYLSVCLVDEKNEPVFTWEEIASMGVAVVSELHVKAMAINGGDTEDLEKN